MITFLPANQTALTVSHPLRSSNAAAHCRAPDCATASCA
jgi:hypothetical protein